MCENQGVIDEQMIKSRELEYITTCLTLVLLNVQLECLHVFLTKINFGQQNCNRMPLEVSKLEKLIMGLVIKEK